MLPADCLLAYRRVPSMWPDLELALFYQLELVDLAEAVPLLLESLKQTEVAYAYSSPDSAYLVLL